MGTEIKCAIISRETAAIVEKFYLGGTGLVVEANEILHREPDYRDQGFASWGNVDPALVGQIAGMSTYGGAIRLEDLAETVHRFPGRVAASTPAPYLWCVFMEW